MPGLTGLNHSALESGHKFWSNAGIWPFLYHFSADSWKFAFVQANFISMN